jgi:hypothetical protein
LKLLRKLFHLINPQVTMTTTMKDRVFEIIEGVLYCFDKALLESGLSTNYYCKKKSIGGGRLQFISHPIDKRYSLVAFETMSEDHQQKIRARFGNPFEFVVKEPIREMIIRNDQVHQSLLDYRYNDGKMLPIRRIRQYSRACDILELIARIDESRNKPIKELGITVPQFYEHLKSIIQEEQRNGDNEKYEGTNQLYTRFPHHYVSLRDKVKEYKDRGIACVVDKAYGNASALKIKDEVAEAHLLSLIENPNQYDDVLVCMMYNTWAEKNDYKIIDPATVGVWRRKKAPVITMGREGNSAFNEKFIRQAKGRLPATPLTLVEHDDYNFNFLYSNSDTKNDFNRYVGIIVIDSRTKLVLGKSVKRYSDTSFDGKLGIRPYQIYHAYLDAMYYIRSLTGGWYLPFEIKSDKWSQSSLTPFYEKVAKFIVPAFGNKHRGYIEPFFGSPLVKRAEKLASQGNYNGNNMEAKYRGVNMEALRESAKVRPMIGAQAETQIERFFQLVRNMPDVKRGALNSPSREQLFLQEWKHLKEEDKRPISEEQFLLTFGVTHNPQGRTIAITNRGVEPQINNQKLSYDLPETWMYEKLVGTSVNVIYDPFDLSRVLVTNGKDVRFIARTAQLVPRAMKDQYTGSRTFLNALLAEKKDQVRRASEASESRRSFISDDLFDAEALLKGGVLVKELKNDAEQKLLEATNDAPYDPFDDM